MENTKSYLIDNYNALAYTHDYIIGYKLKGMVYGAMIHDNGSLLDRICSVERSSSKNGGMASLRYKQNTTKVLEIMEKAERIESICTVDYLEAEYKSSKMNRGDIFEILVQKTFGGQLATKRNLKFTEGGDIEINGKAYQIKFDKATFTDERTIQNLKK